MNVRLLDTNIVSYVMNEHSLAELYRPHLEGRTLAISFMTIAELYHGAYRARWGKKRLEGLEVVLRTYAIYWPTLAMCRSWGEVRVQRRRQPISGEDAWIAATALTYGLPLVTHNAVDFKDIPGLQIITVAAS